MKNQENHINIIINFYQIKLKKLRIYSIIFYIVYNISNQLPLYSGLQLIGGIVLRLSKIKICNYRCFGDEEQIINVDDLTAFIGNNSTGKTAALQALNCIFSENSADRILKRSDFHLPKDKKPDELEKQELYIETVFQFDELTEDDQGTLSIPPFFQSLVVDAPNGTPYLRIRLEGIWEKSSSTDGAVEYDVFYITCPEGEKITEECKTRAKRHDLDRIRVIYVPAVRDPSKQLKNTSGTMMYQLMNSIKWSEETKSKVTDKIEELNSEFLKEKGVGILNTSIHSQWTSYDSDQRYSDAQLHFNSTSLDTSIKNAEVVFSPTVIGKECTVDDMSDGLRSLFYISLVDSFLDVEKKIQEELDSDPENTSFDRHPPILTIIALEEPENHIAPHLIGQLISNIKTIAEKSNAQAIVTSHSTAIIKRFEPDYLRYFRLDLETCTTKVRSISLPDSESQADQYKYIKEAVKAYPELYFAKLVVLGEGDSEEIILPKFWAAKNGDIDISGISVVPLGGRHVNHFWRLLDDLKIPHITLLDLDRERDGGGWGRIKYALQQLIVNGYNKKELLETDTGMLSDAEFGAMHTWNVEAQEDMQPWIDFLEQYDVYFSSPLDVDFLMLEYYGNQYKRLLKDTEGPRLMVTENGKKKQRLIKDIENLPRNLAEYTDRVQHDVHNTLKDCGGEGITYTEEQKKLMVWYTYFFLNRGKPTTHIEALSKMTNEELVASMPPVFSRMISAAEKKLRGDTECV